MRLFQDRSTKSKLTVLSVLASGSALILACAAFVAYDLQTFRGAIVRKLSTQANIVGYNSAAALLFGDPKGAADTLAALSAEPEVVAAAIYNSDGRLFARYGRAGVPASPPSLPELLSKQGEGHEFKQDRLELSRRIVFNDEVIGRIVIEASLDAMRVRLWQVTGIAVLVLLVSTLGSVLISLRLQRRIAQPILDLVKKAKTVSQDKDDSARPALRSRDEVMLLVETFNEMLARIQKQSAALQAAHDDLEERVVERTAELEAANKELEAFSYTVSHDLRAPLRHIEAYSELLRKGAGSALDETSRRYLTVIIQAANRLGLMIDHLLAFSRTGRAAMQKTEIDLDRIVKEVVQELRADADSRRIDWRVEPLPKIVGDPFLLRLVFLNLLSNAIKFTRKRTEAEIGVGCASSSEEVVVFVRDNGAGFDMKYADKLFGVFQRLHRAEEFEGTGIGLANVRRIIARHGGRTWAEGAVDQGATFYLSLPVTQKGE